MSRRNREIAERYYRRLYSRECSKAMDETLCENYVEHQYTADFSKAGLRDYVETRLGQNPNYRVVLHKVLSDSDFVFLLVEEKLSDCDIARGELFRVDGDCIAEHWSAHVIDQKNRKNSNGTFDGPLPNRNVDYARRAVDRFEALDLRGFDQQEIECFYESRVTNYKQHSPKGADGLEGLVSILKTLKEKGQKMIMMPKRVLVDGDFIVCHRLYDSEPKHPLINRINTFDLFRFNEAGKAVEHWDVMEDVPSEKLLPLIF